MAGAPSPASEPVVPSESSPRSSIIRRAGNRSRISSASSGWRSRYSRRVGVSPRRLRSRNSSARASTGLRWSLEAVIGGLLLELFLQARDGREDLLEPFQGPDVAVAGGRLA